MNRGDPDKVLIAGGGVAALEAALALRALAADRVAVELLAPETRLWYRAAAVAEPFELGAVRHYELTKLAADAGATFSSGKLVSVDSARRIAYTEPGGAVPFSMLLIACGAVPKPAIGGAVTFRGPADTEKIELLLAELEAEEVRRVAFAVPAGAVWSLPAYELALMTADWLARRGIEGVQLALVTPEDEPLHLFGREASDAVRALLEEGGVTIHTRAYPAEARDGKLFLLRNDAIAADRVIALPRLQGPRIGGVPQTFEGFISVDVHGRVTSVADVYAAGDITNFPVKQGGIAAQQADAAAEAIAGAASVQLTPRAFRPVLRGLLLTGKGPRYLRRDLDGEASESSPEPLWWPPAKIVGRYLTPFLADVSGAGAEAEPPADAGVTVSVELDAEMADNRRDRLLEAVIEDALGEPEGSRVGDVMSGDPLLVAPEDTLGEVAERMRERDTGSVLVAEYGQLIGILTSRDMLRAFADRAHPSEGRVRQWMTTDPIVVGTTTTLEAARILMTEHHIHHLPVVEAKRPVGMVGMRDLVREPALGAGIGLGF